MSSHIRRVVGSPELVWTLKDVLVHPLKLTERAFPDECLDVLQKLLSLHFCPTEKTDGSSGSAG